MNELLDEQGHLKTAQGLYRQRQLLLPQPSFPADGLTKLEWRLVRYLDMLTRAGYAEETPAKPPAAFVAVAVACLRDNAQGLQHGLAVAEAEPGLLEAVFDAFGLFPPAALDTELEALYQNKESLRLALLTHYHRLGQPLPQGLLAHAESQDKQPELQAAALRYAADRPEFSGERFPPYYRAEHAEVQQAALWGGLLRKDPDAKTALRAALEHAQDKDSGALLRLLALAGEADDFPILERYAEHNPAAGLPLLALYGRQSIVPALLAALDNPASAEPAAAAWQTVFGEALPVKPRLAVVEGDSQQAVEEGGALPDSAAARAHWQQVQARWSAEARWLDGRAMTPTALAERAAAQAGAAGADALALLALINPGTAVPHPQAWQHRRHTALQPLLSAVSAQPEPEVRHA
ncbi:hypothetical protein CAI21_08500 [Alkalilimnicola ehrlichii]|uniref:Uncharacterized protein n=1 Tax=Alkalilimnicola ehrlichii TaxID=351052 RepID=A0A3E0WWB0_9GAMM|nr:hypothetical protein [Alkalilimnicola ehrlichii]RFA29864.1 hypothetical protein CAI21_08500 [Alkalilimnicola ehrlichii]RFA36451.1 hypothetical protein CAL65_10760 [Alkalilimnicola ehrlichii]